MSCCSSCWVDRVSLCFCLKCLLSFCSTKAAHGRSASLLSLKTQDAWCEMLARSSCVLVILAVVSLLESFFLTCDASICSSLRIASATSLIFMWLFAFHVIASSASCLTCLFLHFMICANLCSLASALSCASDMLASVGTRISAQASGVHSCCRQHAHHRLALGASQQCLVLIVLLDDALM